MSKVLMSWSGGKDSANALHKCANLGLDVVGLLTTFSGEHKRVTMHGIQEDLIEHQSKSIGIPLIKMYLNEASHEHYENQMKDILKDAIEKYNISGVVFGDIFLEDLKQYRIDKLKQLNLKAYFPLWGKNTVSLIREFRKEKFKTIVCCVNLNKGLDELLGTELQNVEAFDIDPCGENGEYHSFCFDGPIFNAPIEFTKGETKEVSYPSTNNNQETIEFRFLDLA